MKRLLVCLALLITCVTSNKQSSLAADTVFPFDLRDHPLYLIASYYNAITLKDFARAYNYWNGHEPGGATLAEFTAGMSNTDTESIRVLARLPVTYDGAAGTMHAGSVQGPLGEVIAGIKPGRRSDTEIVIFDSTGTALQDVAAATLVYQRALRDGIGIPVPLGN